MTGYVRVDTGNNIADGNVINAADLDNEFDGVQAAFNSSTGHTHDGTSGEGAPITKIGPVQDVVVSISAIYPKTTNTVDLGTSSLKYKDLHLAGNSLLGGTLGVTGAATFTGAIVSDSTTDSTSTLTGAIQTDGGLGVAKALWVGGLANIAGATTLQGTLTGSDATDSTSTVSGAFKTAGGLGVAKALWVGGLANIAGAATLQSTLAVTGVATLTAQPILSSLTASKAVFSDGSKGLVSNDITGTGNVVMSASPTLTGTLTAAALTTSGTVTHNGGTANGVAYLNGSKVLTTGSALTFDGTNLGLSGAAGRQLNITDTGGAAVRVSTDSGVAYVGTTTSHPLSLFTAGVIRATFDTSGNLGLGVTPKSGAYKSLEMDSTGAGIQFQGTFSGLSQNTYYASGWKYSTSSLAAAYWQDTGIHKWFTAPSGTAGNAITFTQAMTLNASGNLGLGVTPSASWSGTYAKAFQLGNKGASISGFTSSLSSIPYVNIGNNSYYASDANWKYYSANGAALYQQAEKEHRWLVSSGSPVLDGTVSFTQAMTLDASGRLIVGGTSPATDAQLTISAELEPILFFQRAQGGNSDAAIHVTSGGAILFKNGADSSTAAGLTERARIDGSGNLLVGTTTSAGRMTVQSASTTGVIARFQNSSPATIMDVQANGDIIVAQPSVRTGTTLVWNASGYISLASSSLRYKKDIEQIDIGLDFVLGLNPVKYKLKDSDEDQVGFIAEDFPDSRFVSYSPVDSLDPEKGLQVESINYAQVVAPLVKAIQEQQAIITQLQADVAALKAA